MAHKVLNIYTKL